MTPTPSELPARWREQSGVAEPGDDKYLVGLWNARLQCASELTASLAAHPVTGWRPIETAPKDGTRVMLLESCGTSGMVASWSPAGWNVDRSCYFEESLFTHWSPLPGAPDPLAAEVERLANKLESALSALRGAGLELEADEIEGTR